MEIKTKLLYILVASYCVPANAQFEIGDANNLLTGTYFVREVAFSNYDSQTGQPAHTRSLTGLATFDGNGNYSFTGTLMYNVAGATAQPYTYKGGYLLSSSGLLEIDSLINREDVEFGGIAAPGPGAIIASATEGPFNDLLIAVPVDPSFSLSTFSGTYRAGYIDFLKGDVSKVRSATFTLASDGQGSLAAVSVNGSAANMGGALLSQMLNGATYAIDPSSGLGAINFDIPDDSRLISGTKVFAVSRDGSIVIGGDPNGYDLMAAVRPFSGSAAPGSDPNAAFTGTYFLGQLLNDTSNLPDSSIVSSDYGSIRANGAPNRIFHLRYDESDLTATYDFTFDEPAAFDETGTIQFDDGSVEVLGAAGSINVGVGAGQQYSLGIALRAMASTADGYTVFVDPTSVANTASLAPITNPISFGEYITLSGSNLAPASFPPEGVAPTTPLPTILDGVQVTLNGNKAPIYSISPTRITFVAPDLLGLDYGPTTIHVINNGVKSNGVTVWGNAAAPGVWTVDGSGAGLAMVEKVADHSMVSADNPVSPGDQIIIYCSGLGTVTPRVPDGAAASSPGKTNLPLQVLIDGQQAKVSSSGLTPGFALRYQITVTVPDGITPAAMVPLGVALFDSDGNPLAETLEAKIATAQ